MAAAVSGGVDSVVLLDKLARARKELDIELMVINVEHGIRAESKADSLFVKELAAGYGVPFFCFEVDSPSFAKANKLSEETAARILRYRAFEKFDGCDVIALAHHILFPEHHRIHGKPVSQFIDCTLHSKDSLGSSISPVSSGRHPVCIYHIVSEPVSLQVMIQRNTLVTGKSHRRRPVFSVSAGIG